VSEREWDWPDTPAAQHNLETLSALARAIGMAAPGRFVLLLVKCNLPAQRETLAERLRAMLEPLGVELVEVRATGVVGDLLSLLESRLKPDRPRPEPAPPERSRRIEEQPLAQSQPAVAVAETRASYSTRLQALSVHGLEASLRSSDPHPPLLTHLNLLRERYRDLGCPLVVWLPDYALTRLAREAPDFWAWRSGVFEFAPEAEVAESALRQMAYEPGLVTSSLDAAAKRERLALLGRLLDDYRELGEGPQEQDAQADILWKVGGLHQDLGEYGQARQAYGEALEIKQQLGDRAGVATSLHNLGNVAYLQGDYPEARRLYQESLAIKQQLGDRAGVAKTLHQLGLLAQATGDYPEARRLYQESLAIAQQLGDRAGVAQTLHQLGMLAQDTGDYAEARRLYQESLAIKQQLGDRAGVAKTLHQLGLLAQDTGDYPEARRLYQESLAIAQQLGDRAGVATTLHQLGMLAQDTGDYPEARRLYQESLAIAQQLGDRAGVATTLHQLGMLAKEDGNLEEAQRLFAESLATLEALRSPDAAIARRSLERVRERLQR